MRIRGERGRRILALILTLLLVAGCFGCGKEEKEEKKLPTSEGFTNDVLMRIDGVDVSYAEANIYLLSMREEVEALYGAEIWDIRFTRENRPYSELMKERLLEKLIYIKLVCHMAPEFNVKLEADDFLNVNDYTQQYLSGITESTAKKYGITEDLVRSIYNDNVLAEKTFRTITLNADTTYSEDEVLRAKFNYIFLSKYYEDAEGNRTAFSEEDMRALWTKAETYRTAAAESKDFYNYAKGVTNASTIEITVGRADLPVKSRNAAFALHTGEMSEVIEEDDGLYIFYCADERDKAATQIAEEEKIAELSRAYFDSLYEKWKINVKIEINEALWEAM
ncbi:MAG: hypothetical protein IK055_10340 [Lachnospiraceae bacterium]|nr:hypothetical protein [Lachnospiraceae bacterium]